MWPVSRSLSWSTWCRLARWEDSLAGSCKPSLSCLSCLCVISWTECWREEVQPGTGEDTESRTCLADVTVTGPLVWQLSSVRLRPPLSRTPPLIGHNTHPVDQSGPMGVADTSFHIKPYFQKRSWLNSFFSAPLCFLREGHKYNTCLINFAFLCWMRQPPNKMTKGGLSSRVQRVAKVLEHLWRVTSTQQFEQGCRKNYP